MVQPSPPAPPAPAPTPPAPASVPTAPTLPPLSNPYIHYRYPQQPSTPGVLYPGNPSSYPYTTSSYPSVSSTQHTSLPAQQSPFPQWPPPPPPSYPPQPHNQQNAVLASPATATTSAHAPTSAPAPAPSQTLAVPSAQAQAPRSAQPPQPAAPVDPPQPPPPVERKETVAKQYVVHEITQAEKSRPNWASTMTAMFGDHAEWEKLRVYTSKGRPLSKPITCCRCAMSWAYCLYSTADANMPHHWKGCEVLGPSDECAIRGPRCVLDAEQDLEARIRLESYSWLLRLAGWKRICRQWYVVHRVGLESVCHMLYISFARFLAIWSVSTSVALT